MKSANVPPKPKKSWLVQMLLLGLACLAWAGWGFWHDSSLGIIDSYLNSKMLGTGLFLIAAAITVFFIKRK